MVAVSNMSLEQIEIFKKFVLVLGKSILECNLDQKCDMANEEQGCF